ncbi:MAG: LytTR family DNA-binding domain-containing protein [Cyclobacteriaceae bacterium]|nr:LytTR family DNA-binding domain-containing protein [Cyclobacteriaceae bacterium]
MNCLIIDDEPLARDLIEDNVRQVPFLKLVAKCAHPMEAMDIFATGQVDLIFLDIQMPGVNGVQFLQSLSRPVLSIFITAYEKFALEGYNLDVVDYLLKPVPFDRFLKAVNKAHELYNLRHQRIGDPIPDFVFVHADYNLVKVNFSEVVMVEGLKDYVKIFLTTSPRPVITRMSMKAVEDVLPSGKFVRVHKSFVIALDKVISVRKGKIRIGVHEVPLGDSYADKFYQLIRAGQE